MGGHPLDTETRSKVEYSSSRVQVRVMAVLSLLLSFIDSMHPPIYTVAYDGLLSNRKRILPLSLTALSY